MKLAFILLGLFFVFISVRTEARELTQEETLALIPYKNAQVVKTYMESTTPKRQLSWNDRLAFEAFRKACVPLELHLDKVEREVQEYPDQTKIILQLYALCSEGTMGLSRLYIKTKEGEESL